MGRDRTTTTSVGGFVISVDRDHLGSYRGNQAMERRKYRGWHYHIESEKYDQIQIMDIIEGYLLNVVQAEKYECQDLFIGVVEHLPERVSCFRKEGKTTVLWISGFNGKLHIESNKKELYTPNLISKKDLINIFKEYNIEAIKNE